MAFKLSVIFDFVAFDSADVGQIPGCFIWRKDGSPTVVKRVPPDYFSVTDSVRAIRFIAGMRWRTMITRGGPDGCRCVLQADIVRIDHFRGFDAYWEIPASEETAVIGKWIKGPDKHFFRLWKNN